MDRLLHDAEDSKHRSLAFLLTLCAGWFGLQQIFTVFFGSGYFYLASLGFSDTTISLLWLSGPSAGLFFQPLLGALSDRWYNHTHHHSPWGRPRRRPLVVVGTLVLICAMLSLAWAQELTALAFSTPTSPRWDTQQTGARLVPLLLPEEKKDHHHHHTDAPSLSGGLSTLVTASILVANLAIQPVQLGLRAMATDLVPLHQQAQAQAWIARLNVLGSLVGYGLGAAPLSATLPFLGHTPFQILCSLVSINLAVCVAITCSLQAPGGRRGTRGEALVVGQARPLRLTTCRSMSSPKKQPPRRRLGARLRALTVARRVCVAQVFCWLAWFPFLYDIAKYVGGLEERERDLLLQSQNEIGGPTSSYLEGDSDTTRAGSLAMLIFASVALVASAILPQLVTTRAAVAELPDGSRRQGHRPKWCALGLRRGVGMSLRRTWLACQIIFSMGMLSTFFFDSLGSAYVLVALMGIPWAAGTWIPFTLLSQDLHRAHVRHLQVGEAGGGQVEAETEAEEDVAATVIGLHNAAISAPQMAAALGSSLLFYLVGSPESKGVEVWLLRAGGLSALAGAWLIKQVPEES